MEYFKNDKASNDKLRNGWIYTGDLVRRDSRGYLYFVGRNAEFMRIKGENVSAYEVEHTIQKHPSVVEAAVYAVPSELAEDEIMACVSLVEGHNLKEAGPDRLPQGRPGEIRRAALREGGQGISQDRNAADHKKGAGESGHRTRHLRFPAEHLRGGLHGIMTKENTGQ